MKTLFLRDHSEMYSLKKRHARCRPSDMTLETTITAIMTHTQSTQRILAAIVAPWTIAASAGQSGSNAWFVYVTDLPTVPPILSSDTVLALFRHLLPVSGVPVSYENQLNLDNNSCLQGNTKSFELD